MELMDDCMSFKAACARAVIATVYCAIWTKLDAAGNANGG